MKKTSKMIMITLFLLGSGLIAQGQTSSKSCCSDNTEKSGCSPSACGPHGTKTEESVAVTKLRSDLQSNIDLIQKTSFDLSKSFKGYKLPVGKNEEESLLIIMRTIYALKAEIIEKSDSDKIVPGFKAKSETLPSTKREMMVYLIKETNLIGQQIQQL